jgi:Mg-chelatase subunit ChlD
MKRILFDVPKWDLFLHREHRQMPRAKAGDDALLRLQDELFEHLYAGGAERLAENDVPADLRPWAERFHGTCDELPAFRRLAAECRGDAAAAAAAVDALLDEIDIPSPASPSPAATPGTSKDPLRRPLAAACRKASGSVDELREMIEGLAQVCFTAGYLPGSGPQHTTPADRRELRPLAARLKNDARLRRIGVLAGRLKRIAATKRRQRVKHGADEISDVEQGADLARALPAELSKLAHPRLRLAFIRSLLERQVLQYQLSGAETLGRGPIVLLLDKSGSMDGVKDVWATALSLALLEHAHEERRPFAILDFNGSVTFEVTVEPGQQLPHEALFVGCGGGTSIAAALERGLEIIAHHPRALRRGDIVLVTDGGSDTEAAARLRERAHALGVTILGLAIGVRADVLAPWCDEAHGVEDLSSIGEDIATPLFAS